MPKYNYKYNSVDISENSNHNAVAVYSIAPNIVINGMQQMSLH